MNMESREFARQAKLPFRLGDGEWLKLRYDGFTSCVIIYFNNRLSYSEIQARMLKAFGDLK